METEEYFPDLDSAETTIKWYHRIFLWLYPTEVIEGEGFKLYYKEAIGNLYILRVEADK